MKPFNILLVEDNPADIRLIKEAFNEGGRKPYNLSVVNDGEEAICFLLKKIEKYLHNPSPDLIILDINLPRKSGHEVLSEIKCNSDLKCIPVIVFSTSSQRQDIYNAYSNHANCYIVKPTDYIDFLNIAAKVENFWLETACLLPCE